MANRKPQPPDAGEWRWSDPRHTRRTVRYVVNDEFGVDVEERRWGRAVFTDEEMRPVWVAAIDAMTGDREAVRVAVCRAFRALQRRRKADATS